MGTTDTWAEASFNERESQYVHMTAGRPVCSSCGEPIMGCDAWKYNDDWFCDDCWHDFARDEFYVDLDLYLGDE